MRLNGSRQLLLLVAVSLVLVVGGPRAPRRQPGREGARAVNSSTGSRRRTRTRRAPADVKLELLKTAPAELDPSTRNPFQFKPKAPLRHRAAWTHCRAGLSSAPPPVPPGPPPPPPIALKYIGVLGHGAGTGRGVSGRRRGHRQREGRRYHRWSLPPSENRRGIGRSRVCRRTGPPDDSTLGTMMRVHRLTDRGIVRHRVALALTAAGCGASRSCGRAENAARAGDWDAAVEYYRKAVQEAPDRTDYKIALERAMINASHEHLNQAQLAEARGELEEALREYRRASDFDPPNRQLAAKVRRLSGASASSTRRSPANNIAQLREQARQAGPPPLIKLTEVLPEIRFNNTSIRDILNFDRERDGHQRHLRPRLPGPRVHRAVERRHARAGAQPDPRRPTSCSTRWSTRRTIMVIPDTAQKRANYEEQVIRTFYVSHADATELSQMINTIIRVPAMAVQPMIAPNKTNNTITIRATTAVAAIIEKMIESNDKPRAEIVIDVQILEISRERAKAFGLDLTNYQIDAVFSPEADPRGTGDRRRGDATLNSQPAFNLNTITRGISTADFYLAVPSAIVRFLETDSETKLIAKPQLRGAEGQKITLNLGDDIPVPSTVFTPLATGGANTNPLTSFNYRTSASSSK